jgi:hypothetical protein
MRGPDPLQAGHGEHVPHLLLARCRVDRLHRGRHADGEHATRVEGVAQLRVIDSKITAQRVDMYTLGARHAVQGLLDLIKQGEPRARITRIALRDAVGKDKTRGGFGDDTGLASELGRTIAFALDNGRDGGIIGLDDFVLAERFALGQALRLLGDVPMGLARGGEVAQQTPAPGLIEMRGLVEEVLGLLRPGGQGATKIEPRLFRSPHKGDEDLALAPTLAAKAPHDLVQRLGEFLSGKFQARAWKRTLLAEAFQEVEEFF